MRIDNVTINVNLPPLPVRDTSAESFISSLLNGIEQADFALGAQQTSAAPDATQPPAIGQPWPGQGGIYAGVSRGEDGEPDAHLILATEKPDGELAWQAGQDWAKGLTVEGHADFHVPTRFESALLYANLRDQHDTNSWHWTSTQYSGNGAWNQYFNDGGQYYDGKKYEGLVRAVRRFVA